jgi:transposase-like protein
MLTRNQRLSIFLLVSGYSNSEVAAEIGVTPRTIRRWMKIKLFAQTLEVETRHACEAARAQAHCTARRLMDNATAALRALQPILLSDRTDPKVIVRAADITLRNATRWLNVLEDEPHVPMLQMESADDVGAENEIESEAQQTQPDEDANADEPTRCPTMREEEVAQIDAIRRKMDGQYPDSSGDVGSAGAPRLPSLVLDGDTNTKSGRRGTPALPTP